MVSDRLQRQIDRLLDEAEEAIGRRDWAAVRDSAQAVLRLDPVNKDAVGILAAAEREPAGPGPQTPASPPPMSFVNGRYEAKRFLGEGGNKRVYQ